MSHDNHNEHHSHSEAQQNEIGAPVLFALVCVVMAIVIIWMCS
ncbi:MAG: hypothetical protein ACKVOR_13300 [Flavobacteriales bacterium]